MNDDYLWDGSGDIDPEVERLENLLGRYRHSGTAPRMPVTARRFDWSRLAIAAALVLTLAGGLLLALSYRAGDAGEDVIADHRVEPNLRPDVSPVVKPENPPQLPNRVEALEAGAKPSQKIRPAVAAKRRATRLADKDKESPLSADDPWQIASTAAIADLETARYLEQAGVLLRSFRNVDEREEAIDVSLEREQSRDLLYKNMMLRRTAEASGNMQVSDLLGSLEPILIDIANLPESPTRQDVRLIKDFIQQKEMVATIQVYSSTAVSMVTR